VRAVPLRALYVSRGAIMRWLNSIAAGARRHGCQSRHSRLDKHSDRGVKFWPLPRHPFEASRGSASSDGVDVGFVLISSPLTPSIAAAGTDRACTPRSTACGWASAHWRRLRPTDRELSGSSQRHLTWHGQSGEVGSDGGSGGQPGRRRISVVIPALNEQALIGSGLSSLAAQDFGGDVEVIVVDNGSTDATADIARAWGATVVKEPLRGRVSCPPARYRDSDW
jgi:hypothetical protein